MSDEIIIQFHPNGQRFAIWTEEVPLEQLGTLTTKRASNIERNDETGLWEVTMAWEDAPRFAHKSRKTCLAWEVDYIHANMTQIMQQHFQPN